MGCLLMHILGIVSGCIGMILTWIITFMHHWRLVVLAENNGLVIDTGRIDGTWFSRYDGLWETCLYQYRETKTCSSYESQVSLTADLKASRVFMCFAIGLTVLAFICSILGIVLPCMCCCCCSVKERRCLTLTAGLLYLVSLILILISVIWTTVYISRRAYGAAITQGAVRIEIGEALMLAWPCIAFVLFAGVVLTAVWICPCGCPTSNCSQQNNCSYKAPVEQPKECRDECSDVRSTSVRMQYL